MNGSLGTSKNRSHSNEGKYLLTGCITQSTLQTKPIIFAPEQKKFLEKGSSLLIFLFRLELILRQAQCQGKNEPTSSYS